MATDYRIIAKIDPAGVKTGADEVKQELKSVDVAATATGAAMKRAFDQQALDRSIAGLVGEMGRLRTELAGVVSSNGQLASSNQQVAASMTATVAAAARAAAAEASVTRERNAGAVAASNQERALLQVLRVIDPAAAEQRELNALLAQAKELYEAGALSATQYAKATQLASNAQRGAAVSAGQQRAGYAQLSFQIQDITQSYALGFPIAQIFAQQLGQTASAVQLATGSTKGLIGFLAGPYGAVLIGATTILAVFASKWFETSEATEAAKREGQKYQSFLGDINNFIDETTGKLVGQSNALNAAAQGWRNLTIAQLQNQQKEGASEAFARASEAAVKRTEFTAERQPGRKVYDLDIARAVTGAGSDVEKLITNLDKLRRTRPDLGPVIDEIVVLGGKSLFAAKQIAEARKESLALTGAGKAGQPVTARSIELEVQLATAQTARERAQAKLAIVQARGSTAEKAGGKALDQYRKDLTAATVEVNRAESSEKALKSARGESTKAAREAAKAAREGQRYEELFATIEAQKELAGVYGLQAQVLQTQLNVKNQLNRALTPAEEARIENAIREADATRAVTEAVQRVKQPVEEYERAMKALNTALALGKISQDEFNAAVRAQPMREAAAQLEQSLGGTLTGIQSKYQAINDEAQRQLDLIRQLEAAGIYDPLTAEKRRGDVIKTQDRRTQDLDLEGQRSRNEFDAGLGGQFQLDAEKDSVILKEKERQALLLELREQEIFTEAEYERRKVELHRQSAQEISDIETSRRRMALSAASDIFGSLADIAAESVGKQSAAYKVLFSITKAFAIAESVVAIQQGIAKAISLGFPQNIPVIAGVVAQGASILANIRAASMAFADGGMVNGPGGPRSDSILARLSNGEFVVNAAATARNRPALEAINSGRSPANDNRRSMSIGSINVNVQSSGNAQQDGQLVGREVKKAVRDLARDEMQRQQSPGGILTRPRASVMTN